MKDTGRSEQCQALGAGFSGVAEMWMGDTAANPFSSIAEPLQVHPIFDEALALKCCFEACYSSTVSGELS
jgi:hypothetical protein